MAVDFNTIHIFGYGETQLIKKDVNFKLPTTDLTTVVPAVANIYSKKPADSDASSDYHAVNLFNNMFVDYQPKTGKGFRVKWTELDANTIEAFVVELNSKVPPATA